MVEKENKLKKADQLTIKIHLIFLGIALNL